MAVADLAPPDFDLRRLPPAFYDDPYPTYRRLREAAPVHRLPDGSLFLTRHADLERVYKDVKTFSSDKVVEFGGKFGPSPLFEHHTTSLVFNDPPLHTRVRRLINGALTPRTIADLEPDLVRLVDGLLDRMAGRSQVDLIEDYAIAIPVEVIGNLLAVPHDERAPLRQWSLDILGALEPVVPEADMRRGDEAVTEFCAYLETLVARRRATPGDPERDLLTRLLAGEAGGERLSEVELLQNCIFILNAGHETTTNLIGNGLNLLLDHPAERRRVIADPGLLRGAVDETLRFDAPVQLGNRRATAPCAMGDARIEAGTIIHLCIGAANRDPAAFADPDRFDVARRPNRHLAFASGPHQCVGMALARLEGRIAIGRFLARFPDYIRAGAPVRGGRARFRGFLSLPVML